MRISLVKNVSPQGLDGWDNGIVVPCLIEIENFPGKHYQFPELGWMGLWYYSPLVYEQIIIFLVRNVNPRVWVGGTRWADQNDHVIVPKDELSLHYLWCFMECEENFEKSLYTSLMTFSNQL